MKNDRQTKNAASEGTSESPCSPKFHPNQMVRVLHTWAAGHPARPVVRAHRNESRNCWTYVLPLSLMQFEEHELEAAGEPDMVPDAWIDQYRANKILQPEILTHPNIPKPLHGIAPRIVKGNVWWDIERKKCYEKAGQMCECCGTPREQAWPNRWLEAHEIYEHNSGIFTFTGLICLCPACHRFIHSGLTELLFKKGEIPLETYERIQKHGHDILKQNGLTRKWKERHNYFCPEWKDFRMCIDGKYYGPSSRDYLSWKRGEWKKWEVKDADR